MASTVGSVIVVCVSVCVLHLFVGVLERTRTPSVVCCMGLTRIFKAKRMPDLDGPPLDTGHGLYTILWLSCLIPLSQTVNKYIPVRCVGGRKGISTKHNGNGHIISTCIRACFFVLHTFK